MTGKKKMCYGSVHWVLRRKAKLLYYIGYACCDPRDVAVVEDMGSEQERREAHLIVHGTRPW